MPRSGSAVALVITGMILRVGFAGAQEPPRPPPVYVPAPPPVYAPAPPPVYAPAPPPVYAPAPPPVYVQAPPPYMSDEQMRRRSHDRMLSRVFTGVGSTMIVFGFFSLVAGIPVLVLTASQKLCTPSSTRSCDAYYAGSYALLGGGAALMAGGIALDVVGTVYRWRARYAKLDLMAPRLALLPSTERGVGGASASLGIRF